MPYDKNASSMELLEEALAEILELSREAQANNPLLSEGLELTPFQRVILERDFLVEQDDKASGGQEEGPAFLEKTTAAVEKLRDAAKKALGEIDAYNAKLDKGIFLNITAALDGVKADIEDKMPGESFLSKIGAGAGMALKSLFGKEDDPVEEVTKLIADVNMFKGVIAKAFSTINDTIGKLEFTDPADETGKTKLEGDALKAAKQKILQTKIEELVNPDGEYVEIGFPDTDGFKKAVAKTFKEPTGMFGGLKKLGGSLGIGLGGDVPLADYIDADKVFDDLMSATPEQLNAVAGAVEADTGASPALQAMGAPLQQLQQTGEDNQAQIAQLGQGAGGAGGAGGSSGGAGEGQSAEAGGGGTGGGTGGPKKQATFEDLVDKVTSPASNNLKIDFAKIMADLINKDPKSGYEFVEKVEQAKPGGDAAAAPATAAAASPAPAAETPAKPPQQQAAGYYRPGMTLTEAYFNSSAQMVKRPRSVTEAIYFKDFKAAMLDAGVAEDELIDVGTELASRLENEYDIEIEGVPDQDIEQAVAAAATAIPDQMWDLLRSSQEALVGALDKITQLSQTDKDLIAQATAASSEDQRAALLAQTDLAQTNADALVKVVGIATAETITTTETEIDEETAKKIEATGAKVEHTLSDDYEQRYKKVKIAMEKLIADEPDSKEGKKAAKVLQGFKWPEGGKIGDTKAKKSWSAKLLRQEKNFGTHKTKARSTSQTASSTEEASSSASTNTRTTTTNRGGAAMQAEPAAEPAKKKPAEKKNEWVHRGSLSNLLFENEYEIEYEIAPMEMEDADIGTVVVVDEDDILSPQDMVLADMEGEEAVADIGPGSIGKLDIANLLKSMPDIVGAGYRATRARRAFRKAINTAAGCVVCDESFDHSPKIANLLIEKLIYNDAVENSIEEDFEHEIADRWNTLAGLNK